MPMPELSDLIKRTPISAFIIPGIPQLNVSEPVAKAVEQYKQSPYGVVFLVQDADGSLAGVLTANDLVGRPSDATPVGTIVPSNRVIAVKNDATLAELLEVLNGGNSEKRLLEKVPVVDAAAGNKPVGIIDRDKLTIQLGEILAAQPA
jgi:CBS domain-containing protein